MSTCILQFKIRKLNITPLTLVLKKNCCMSAYSLLDALSFDISFIEIRQEIKLLEHFGIIKDHLYIYHFFRKFFKAFIPAHVFAHPLITKHEKKILK
jgi:hypothetical protein